MGSPLAGGADRVRHRSCPFRFAPDPPGRILQHHQREKHHRKQAGADEGCACRRTDLTEESPDLNCGHDEAQRRRLQEARSDGPAIAEHVTVQQRSKRRKPVALARQLPFPEFGATG